MYSSIFFVLCLSPAFLVRTQAAISIKKINDCEKKVSAEGTFEIRDLDTRGIRNYCSVKFLAPAGSRLRITIEEINCSRPSFIVFWDGWLIHDRYTQKISFIPGERKDRQNFLCPRKEQQNTSIPWPLLESKQNVAEFAYLFHPGDAAELKVEFIAENSYCDNILGTGDLARPITITNQREAKDCDLYLPGGINVEIASVNLHRTRTEACGTNTSSYLQLSTGDNFDEMSKKRNVCSVTEGGYLLPCKHALLRIHFVAAVEEQSVIFQIKMAPFEQRLIWSALC